MGLRSRLVATTAFAAVFTLSSQVQALPFSDRITLPSGEKIFVSGHNLAWISFAGDVGDAPLDAAKFEAAMKAVADSGGNTMRVWLSTNGANDPKFGADGYVSGLGTKTVANVQQMLSIAKKHKMLLMPVLLTHNFMQDQSGVNLVNNRKMLTTDSGISAYIKNAVVPLVTAIGNDPNLICWEIANEAEGMKSGDGGWTKERIEKIDIQKFTNRMTGAIKRAVPGVLVSTGIVQASYLGWYSDDQLKTVGGDADGTLDFYMVHYYGWNGVSNSPFRKGAAAWGMDKPIVVGEFSSTSWGPSTPSSNPMQDAEKVDTLMENLFKNGYAGGLFWQYQRDVGDPWMLGFATSAPSMAALKRAHPEDVTFDGLSDGKFSMVASGSVGGKVVVSPTGRVVSGTVVTLTATADKDYEFVGWAGDTTVASTVNPLTIKVTKDRNLVANFRPAAGTNLLKNGDFATTTADWQFNLNADGTAKGAISYAAKQADISITTAGAENWHAQLMQGGFALEAGATYILSFDAWANVARDVAIGLTTTDWKWQGGSSASVTTTRKNFQVELTALATVAAGTVGVLQFNVGDVVSQLHIDDVILMQKGGTSSVRAGAQRPSALQVRGTTTGLAWTLPSGSTNASVLIVRDASGREVARAPLAAGQLAGHLDANLPRGVLLVEVDGVGASRLLVP
jgi:hypothetical protein